MYMELVALLVHLGPQHREDSRLTNFNGTKRLYNEILYTFTKKKTSCNIFGIVESEQWRAHPVEIILGAGTRD